MERTRIILTAIFAFMGFQLNAQEYSTGTFNYDFYVGTWEYKTTSEQFILKTWKQTYCYPDKTLTVLRGVFKYTKYGFTVYDHLYLYGKENTYRSISFMIITYLAQERKQPILSIDYTDPITQYDTNTLPDESVLTIVSKNPAKLSWHIIPCNGDYERIRLNPGQIAFTIPADMILTKVEE